MAEDKETYPMLPVAHWWELRKRFKQSIPGVVTASYVATVLDMKENSARANVLPFLEDLGIIDNEGKTGERARLWRDDEQYPEVCKQILKEVYPPELLDAVPNPGEDRSRAERWFANRTGTGDAAAKRMAALYEVLAEADASKQPEENKERAKTVRSGKAVKPIPIAASPALQETPKTSSAQGQQLQPPGININLQVHISADATTDQIDQIFQSMAKHIYQRG